MHFTVIQVVATSLAFLAQFSRIFAVTKPFWGKLPAVIQVWLPPVIPFAAALQASLVGVASWTDFAVSVLVSAALLLPGAPSNRSAAPLQAAKPFIPPPLSMLTLCMAALVLGGGCSLLGSGGSFWPVVAHCAPTTTEIGTAVEAVLLAGGDYEASLEQLTKQFGKDAVVCAADSFANSIGARTAAQSAAKARARAFVEKTETKVVR